MRRSFRGKGGTEPGVPFFLRFLVLLLLAASGCARLPLKGEADADLLLRLSGRAWLLEGPVRAFGPENLYEEIDGEAELFLPYGFRELSVGVFRSAASPGAEVRVELFLHDTPRDAFGVYSQHRFPGQETTEIGTSEAIVSGTSLDFFRGPRYVRIRTASRSAGRGHLESLARDLSALLPGTGEPPRETDALRIPGLVEGTIVFHRLALLGYEALAPGYGARYAYAGISGTLVLVSPEDAPDPVRFVEKISTALPGFERVGEDLWRADLPSGTLWLLSREGFHIGIAGSIDRIHAETVLSEIAFRVPGLSKSGEGRSAPLLPERRREGTK